jgi:hypothetical protein
MNKGPWWCMVDKFNISFRKFILNLSTTSGVPPPSLPSLPPAPPPPPASYKQMRLSDEQIYAILAGMVQNAAAILEVIRKGGCVPEVLYEYFTLLHEYEIVLPGMQPFKGRLYMFISQNSLCMERMREELDKSRIFKIVQSGKYQLVVPYNTPVPDTGYVPYYQLNPWIFAEMLAGGIIEERYIRWTFNGSDRKKGEWWQRRDHDEIARDPRFKWYVEHQNNYIYVPFKVPSTGPHMLC